MPESQDLVQKSIGCIPFREKRKLGFRVPGDQGENIGVSLKSGTGYFYVIGRNKIKVFLFQFFTGIFDKILCFHREAAQKLPFFFVAAQMA